VNNQSHRIKPKKISFNSTTSLCARSCVILHRCNMSSLAFLARFCTTQPVAEATQTKIPPRSRIIQHHYRVCTQNTNNDSRIRFLFFSVWLRKRKNLMHSYVRVMPAVIRPRVLDQCKGNWERSITRRRWCVVFELLLNLQIVVGVICRHHHRHRCACARNTNSVMEKRFV